MILSFQVEQSWLSLTVNSLENIVDRENAISAIIVDLDFHVRSMSLVEHGSHRHDDTSTRVGRNNVLLRLRISKYFRKDNFRGKSVPSSSVLCEAFKVSLCARNVETVSSKDNGCAHAQPMFYGHMVT
jgi:hypothetical protein